MDEPAGGHRSTGDEAAAVRESLTRFAATAVSRLPLYRHLAERAGADGEVAGLLLLADPEDRNPTLLFAAVHDRLLAESSADDPLGTWYPSVSPDPRPPEAGGAGDPWPHFRRLALDDPAVAATMTTRGTQTNEVGRCSTTLPALALLQREVAASIGLVEVGASAGLNLRLDRYGYRWTSERDGATVAAIEGLDSVALTSRARGERPPPAPIEVPDIGYRVGVDREPADVSDPSIVRWLVACQWPEQLDRLQRCRAALSAARHVPVEVRRGDLVAEVEALVAAVPVGCHPVVLSTWVLAYLGPDGQRAFLAALDRAGATRDVTLVVQEEPSFVPGLDLPARPDGRANAGSTALCRVDWRDGERRKSTRLADQHPHGSWAEWFV